MDFLSEILRTLHEWVGSGLFIFFSIAVSGGLCGYAIPLTTDLMVNNSAGLVGKHIGKRYRTLVINASTNNPEAANMAVSFIYGLMGGWANPLGSSFANVYLMFLIAPAWVIGRHLLKRSGGVAPRQLAALIWKERKLVLWHLGLGLFTMVMARLSLVVLRDGFEGGNGGPQVTHTTPWLGAPLVASFAFLGIGVAIFFFLDRRMHRKRPELFESIHEGDHDESWSGLLLGTAGLIACCWVINALFLVWVELYGGSLRSVFGATVFTGLHFFVGALITSLPELQVACRNYARLTVPDLNTALGSATYSNYVNLVLGLVGLAVFGILAGCGIVLPWG